MRRLFALVMLVALLVALLPVAVSAHTATDLLYAKLIAGQTEYVGHVIIWNDSTNLHVTLQAKFGHLGYCLKETHLHVATSLKDIPQTKKGNPIPGRFDYKDDDLGCIHEWEYIIPLGDWEPGTLLFLAAHAVVGNRFDPDWEETGWGVICGQITEFPFGGRNWATYIPYTVQQIDPPAD